MRQLYGAGVVFFFRREVSKKLQKVFNGFAAGVMFAASIWSLIIPAIDMETEQGNIGWIPATIGIIIGVVFLVYADSLVEKSMNRNNFKGSNKKNKMLNLAITLHNIPEGMAVGIVFASCLSGNYGVQIMSAMALSIGIAIQNFPEGMAISLPYKAEGTSNKKAFLIGTLSRNCRAYSSCYNYFIK